jgi:hypothetical protein
VTAGDGRLYVALVFGERLVDGTWHGWIEFHPAAGGSVLSTDRETSQSNRGALEYWAAGLEPVYIDGAFGRAEALVSR